MAEALVCYTIGLNFVTSTNQYFPCGPSNVTDSTAQNCCYAGDYCMENGICHYTHDVLNGTGYYMGACTDKTWNDPACPKACISEYGEGVVYDATHDRWNCCHSTADSLDCDHPTDSIIEAPSPAALHTVRQIDVLAPSLTATAIGSVGTFSMESVISDSLTSSKRSSTSSSAHSPKSSSSTSSPTSLRSSATPVDASSSPTTSTIAALQDETNSNHSGLTGGAKAGIAIGVVIAVLLLVALTLLIFWRRKGGQNGARLFWNPWRSKREEDVYFGSASSGYRSELPGSDSEYGNFGSREKQPGHRPDYYGPRQAAGMHRQLMMGPHELDTKLNAHELPTSGT